MKTKVTYSRCYPLPAYEGTGPVYSASFPWAGSVSCWVRKNGTVWETAVLSGYLQNAQFTPCPVAGASSTRYAAVMAFDYYHNRGVS